MYVYQKLLEKFILNDLFAFSINGINVILNQSKKTFLEVILFKSFSTKKK